MNLSVRGIGPKVCHQVADRGGAVRLNELPKYVEKALSIYCSREDAPGHYPPLDVTRNVLVHFFKMDELKMVCAVKMSKEKMPILAGLSAEESLQAQSFLTDWEYKQHSLALVTDEVKEKVIFAARDAFCSREQEDLVYFTGKHKLPHDIVGFALTGFVERDLLTLLCAEKLVKEYPAELFKLETGVIVSAIALFLKNREPGNLVKKEFHEAYLSVNQPKRLEIAQKVKEAFDQMLMDPQLAYTLSGDR